MGKVTQIMRFADTPRNYPAVTPHKVLSYRDLPVAQQVFLYSDRRVKMKSVIVYLIYPRQ